MAGILIFPQEIIKEKVEIGPKKKAIDKSLDVPSLNNSISMPFYGDAVITLYWHFLIPKTTVILYTSDDPNFNLPHGGTTLAECTTQYWALIGGPNIYPYNNLRAGTKIYIDYVSCQCTGEGDCQWYDLPVNFVQDGSNPNKYSIQVDVGYPWTAPEWRYGGDLTFTQKQYHCQDAPQCTSQPQAPKLDFYEAHDGWCEDDPNMEGYLEWEKWDNYGLWFTPNRNYPKLISPFNLEICYNPNIDRWQIKFDDNNLLTVQYELNWCEENMKNQTKTPLYYADINYIKSQVPPEDYCLAIKEIIMQAKYGKQGAHYCVVDVIKQHEIKHKIDFINRVTEFYKGSKFGSNYYSFNKNCSPDEDFNKIKNDAQDFVNNLIDNFKKGLREFLNTKFSIPALEQETQNYAFQYAAPYLAILKSLAPNCK